jgi:signal transduction histidine kinase
MTEAAARDRYENERRIMDSEVPYRDDAERVVTPDGDVRWFQTVKLPRYDRSGEVVGTLGLSRDITDLKRLEETLSELERLVDRMPVWLLSLDRTETVTWANEAAADALVGAGNDLVGRSLAELVDDGALTEQFREQYESTARQLLSDDETDHQRAVLDRVELSLPDGRDGIYNVHVRLLPTAAGRDRGTVVAFHDVTTQVEQERALERQYERLERLVQTVTHDLRNPLTVALGQVEYAHDEFDDETLRTALASLERIDTLIDELLSMVEVGQAVEDRERVALPAIARDAWQPFEAEPATLTVVDDETILADRGRLLRLFENLFRNAVEHGSTSPGSQARQDPIEHAGEGVRVTVGSLRDGGFYVEDDGPGIPPEEREQVFEHGYTTAQLGTGFGLTIVDEIVSAHGWSITVSESDGGGTRFEVDTSQR